MKLRLIGFDSMGTRGMAAFIDVNGVTIFVDPGANLAPRRFGLPPHEVELEALERALHEIRSLMLEAEYVVVSHYHRDHFLYRKGEEDLYTGKVVLAKDFTRNINFSQRARAYGLFVTRGVSSKVRSLEIADGRSFRIDRDLAIEFSPPLPHGSENTRLGYIVYTVVRAGGKVLVHASDAQGPMSNAGVEFLKKARPNVLIISGPPTYLRDLKTPEPEIEKGVQGLLEVASSMPEGSVIVVDHHLLRDLDYRRVFETVERALSLRGVRVRLTTAAEYMNQPVNQLEARRRELWGRR
ncbi:MBL fold metallo-hydrolase [Thermogladius sp.]|uniref:MBL fold metallo-hydrolase n=1 Tax=Thermogladius sp. TaxID=2023064 RepID=UPI003D0F1D0E